MMICKMCGDGKTIVHSGPCVPVVEPMSAASKRQSSKLNWQCSGCHFGFRGDWQKKCPSCGRENYWTGSVSPDAKEWNPMGDQEDEPTVQWTYSFECNGVRTRSHSRYLSEELALYAASQSPGPFGRTAFRIVKLTRKAKPKVVAKLVLNCTADRGTGLGRVSDWRDDRHGKRIRITLEELET